MGFLYFHLWQVLMSPYLAIVLLVALVLTYFRRQHAERANRNTEIRWFSELHDFGKTLAGTSELQRMADLTEHRAAAMFGKISTYILVQTAGSDPIRHVDGRGFGPQIVETLSEDPLRSYLASSGEKWGNVLVVRDLSRPSLSMAWQRDPLFHELRTVCMREGMRTLLVVGLQVRERSYGVLLVGSRKARSFRPNELRFLLDMCGQLALAVENWSLHRTAERHNQELRTLHHISESLRSTYDFKSQVGILRQELKEVLTTTNFSLALQEWPDGPLRTVVPFETSAAQGTPEGTEVDELAAFVHQTHRPLLLNRDLAAEACALGIDYADRGLRTWCGVPIRFSDGVSGVLACGGFERENTISPEEFELIQVLADEAASAFESTRLFQQEQRSASDLKLVNELAQEAARERNPQELLRNLCSKVRSRFQRDLVRIEVADPQAKELIVEAESGYGAGLLHRHARYGEGLAGAAATKRLPVLANAVQRDPRYVALHPGVRSSLSLPLCYGHELLGVLSLESLREHNFSKQDVSTLQLLADQLAIHLHNTRAYQLALDQAITDGLTGLKTHRFFMEEVEREHSRSRRTGRPFSVLMMDLDGFKRVNDRGGHLEGDRVLAAVAHVLEARSRQSNVVARYGGDEFAVLMPDTTLGQAETLAERLRLAIESDRFLHTHGVTASIGIASFPDHGLTPEDVLRFADSGMYLAKNCGGNRVKVASLSSLGTGDVEREQRLMDAYLEVAMKRMFSSNDEALNQHRDKFKNMKPLLDTFTALAFAVDAKDSFTRRHSQEVSRLATQIARRRGLPAPEVEQIKLAGIVHDIGKIHVPESVLHKPGALTAKEFETMRDHVIWGAKILEPLKEMSIERMVRHHHESFDGLGYPDGLKGEEIPLGARIIAVADAFDAIISNRAYRKARSVDEALAELRRCQGTQFDPSLVETLVRLIESGGGPQTADSVESLVM